MAGGVNKAIILGNLTRDPEVRYTPGGQAVANFSVATNESWTDKSGQKQERAEFHRIVAWGRTAELCGEYLQKGRQVYIEGRLQTREWTNKENQKQWTTEIVANHVTFLGSAPGQGASSHREPTSATNAAGDDFGPPPPGFDDGAPSSAPRAAASSNARLPTTFPNYGKAKGQPIAGATREDLEYYANGARRSLADPAKARWKEQETSLLAAIENELSNPSTTPSGGQGGGGPTEDDIPF